MVSSSSTKRAARLAQKGKGKKVRFQGGTLFPLVVLFVVVLGLALVVYARQSQPAADASPPTENDHWHIAYGFMLCDTANTQFLNGILEDVDANGNTISQDYVLTGVHSHDDGVIHWHPFSGRSVGKRAQLGLFLDNYGVELSDDVLQFPDNQLAGERYEEGETKCGDEDAELSVRVWDSYQDTGDGTTYTSNFDEIRIDNNSMVMVIAFTPRDTDVPMPPWAADLPALGAADQGQTSPVDTTTPLSGPPGTGTAPTGTTPTGSTTPSGSTTPPGSTIPPGTAPPTTLG
ncbi:MAG: hypothetical protein H0U21_16985 [Acidimicrobiia bacterium]|nr:hypothetical protein [Acidimicrobiia bacterium]